MQRLKSITLAPVAADPDGIAQSQQPAAGGVQALTLNGALVTAGVLNVDGGRRIAIASDGDDSGRTFTITGYSRNGVPQVETIAGPNATTVISTKDWGDGAISVTVDDDTAGNITVGTSTTVSSQWVPVDRQTAGLGVMVTLLAGTATYDVEYTLDDPFPTGINVQGDPYLTPFKKSDMQGQSATQEGAFTTPITAVRLTVTAYNAGQLRMNLAPGAVG